MNLLIARKFLPARPATVTGTHLWRARRYAGDISTQSSALETPQRNQRRLRLRPCRPHISGCIIHTVSLEEFSQDLVLPNVDGSESVSPPHSRAAQLRKAACGNGMMRMMNTLVFPLRPGWRSSPSGCCLQGSPQPIRSLHLAAVLCVLVSQAD